MERSLAKKDQEGLGIRPGEKKKEKSESTRAPGKKESPEWQRGKRKKGIKRESEEGPVRSFKVF